MLYIRYIDTEFNHPPSIIAQLPDLYRIGTSIIIFNTRNLQQLCYPYQDRCLRQNQDTNINSSTKQIIADIAKNNEKRKII